MPTETGYVVDTKGPLAVVKTVRSEACKSCSSKGMCDTMGGSAEAQVEVLNNLGARVGDNVTIEMSDRTFVTMSTMVYLVPVLGLIGGMAAGNALAASLGWDKDITSLAAGFLAFGLIMAAVSWIGNNRVANDPAFTPKIISINRKTSA